LYIKDETPPLNFMAEDVDPEFLGKVLRGEVSKEAYEMLRGIALLGERTQRKYIYLLSRAQLTLNGLAKALYRAAVSSRDRWTWERIVEWLRKNGYDEFAGEIVVRKTLL